MAGRGLRLHGARLVGRVPATCFVGAAAATSAGMGRLFLSGQTTCALLLGAGLLLRAQAALRQEPEPAPAAQQAVETPRTRPSELFEAHPPRPARAPRPQALSPRAVHAARAPGRQAEAMGATGNSASQVRKGFAHRQRRAQGKRCGAALAQRDRGFKCG